MARALKVFSTAAGFYTAVVAVPSQKAALEAWGVRENLFASGAAKLVDDPKLIEAALARPGEIVRVPISTDEGFVRAAKPPPKAAGTQAAKAAGMQAAAATPSPKPQPDRSALTAAETALARAKADRDMRLQSLATEMKTLRAKEAALRTELDAVVTSAEKTLRTEQSIYSRGSV